MNCTNSVLILGKEMQFEFDEIQFMSWDIRWQQSEIAFATNVDDARNYCI